MAAPAGDSSSTATPESHRTAAGHAHLDFVVVADGVLAEEVEDHVVLLVEVDVATLQGARPEGLRLVLPLLVPAPVGAKEPHAARGGGQGTDPGSGVSDPSGGLGWPARGLP